MSSGENNQGVSAREIAMIVRAAISESMEEHNKQHQQLLESNYQIANQLSLATDRLSRVTSLAESHEVMLKGNGKVGIVTRVEQMETAVKNMQVTVEKVDESVHEIERSLRGEKDTPGIVGRVSDLERRAENVSKPIWVIISAALSAGVSFLIAHFIK